MLSETTSSSSDSKAYNNVKFEEKHEGIYTMHSDPQSFLEFIKYQRFNFFTKVENDYLVEPENETLQIFKPDDNCTDPKQYYGIQHKLYQKAKVGKSQYSIGNDHVEEKNRKYNNIESLICDSSVVFSEDLKFLFADELNYLHLLIRTKGIEVVNSKYKNGDGHNHTRADNKDQNDLIEIGWKVFSLTSIDMQD